MQLMLEPTETNFNIQNNITLSIINQQGKRKHPKRSNKGNEHICKGGEKVNIHIF